MDGRAGLGGFGFDPRTVHPAASRYTVLYGRRQSSVRCTEVARRRSSLLQTVSVFVHSCACSSD